MKVEAEEMTQMQQQKPRKCSTDTHMDSGSQNDIPVIGREQRSRSAPNQRSGNWWRNNSAGGRAEHVAIARKDIFFLVIRRNCARRR